MVTVIVWFKGALTMQKANNSTSLPLDETRTLILMTSLQELVSFLYISVLKEGPYMEKLEEIDGNDVPLESKWSMAWTNTRICEKVIFLKQLFTLMKAGTDEWFWSWIN